MMDAFLRFNGYCLPLSNEETYELVLSMAQSGIGKGELTVKIKGTITPRQP
jgi:prophage maintenance system killer protein